MSLDDVVARVFQDAMPRGDLTARHLRLDDAPRVTRLFARDDLTLAARETLEIAVRMFAPTAEFHWQFENGARVLDGQIACWIKAAPRAVLTAESLMLDLLSRASGVATLTAAYVESVKPSRAQVTCAPRATPGLRALEFAGIAAGGGLAPTGDQSDTLVVGANLARAAGSLESALAHVRTTFAGPVHAECTNLADVEAAVAARVARVMLNHTVDARAARALVPSFIPLEAGGRPSLAEAAALAHAGVDLVRVEQLTLAPPRREFSFDQAAP